MSAPVLHWPKLFEGWMLTGEYRNHGDGELTGDGLGGGYIGGSVARRGDGNGYGWGDTAGGAYGTIGDGGGGGPQSYGNGNGYAKRSV